MRNNAQPGSSRVDARTAAGSILHAAVVLSLVAVTLVLPVRESPLLAGETGQLQLTGPYVVDYEHMTINGRHAYDRVEFIESRRLLRQGERLPSGGCEFSSETVVQPGERIHEVELAYDPVNCRSLVEVGVVARTEEATEASSVSEALGSSLESESDVGETGGGGGTGSATAARRIAWAKSYHEEPFQLDVSSAYTEVEWTPGGSCTMAAGTTGWMRFHLGWLTGTGWKKVSHNWNNSGSIIDCNEPIKSEVFAHFRNDSFCAPFPSTHTYYEPNSVRGFKDGSAKFTHTMRKEGPCASFLASHQEHDNIRK